MTIKYFNSKKHSLTYQTRIEILNDNLPMIENFMTGRKNKFTLNIVKG